MSQKKEELNENWARCLNILDWFISLCNKYEIKYQMAYGSALGTVRHSGFIPWDKNLDVSMPVSDYRRFISIVESELPDELTLVSYDKKNDFGRQIPRVVYKNNIDEKKWYNPNLDISVWVGAPNSRIKQKIFLLLAYYNNKFFRLKNLDIKRKFPFNVFKLLLCFIPNHFLINQFNNLCNKYDYDHSNYVISLECVYAKEIFPKEIVDNSIEMEFEGRKVSITKSYDVYLKQIYGEYNKPIVFKKHR